MVDKLSNWLNTEIRQRGWSHRELARRSGMSHSQIGNVLNKEKNAGADFCISVARALGEPPERLLRMAGLLPPLPLSVQEDQEALILLRRLAQPLRRAILVTMRNLLGIRTLPTIHEEIPSYLIDELVTLSPEDQQRVRDFIRTLEK